MWSLLGRLRKAGVTHGQIDDAHLLLDADAVGIDDLRGAALTAGQLDLPHDEAQALVSTALALGPERAVTIAREAIGAPGWPRCCPTCRPRC